MILYPRLSRLFPPALLVHPAHLKKSPITGHLLKNSSGHLVKACGCDTTAASSYTVTFSGISWGCVTVFDGGPNHGVEVIQDPNTTFNVPWSSSDTTAHVFSYHDPNPWYRIHQNGASPCVGGTESTRGLRITLTIGVNGDFWTLLMTADSPVSIFPFLISSSLSIFRHQSGTGPCATGAPTLSGSNECVLFFSGNCFASGGVGVASRNS